MHMGAFQQHYYVLYSFYSCVGLYAFIIVFTIIIPHCYKWREKKISQSLLRRSLIWEAMVASLKFVIGMYTALPLENMPHSITSWNANISLLWCVIAYI